MSLTAKAWQVTALYFRPVDNRLDDFDDRTSTQKSLWGVYATRWLGDSRANGFDVYYLGLRDRNAVYDQGAGRELVRELREYRGGTVTADLDTHTLTFQAPE